MPSNAPKITDLFVCTQCGDCCKGYGGTYVTSKEIDAIAAFIGVERDCFIGRYCQISGGRPLLAQGENGYCLFWDTVCTIHPVKPRMCRHWPFIAAVVKEAANWRIMAQACPGMRTELPETLIVQCVQTEIARRSKS
jgi:Fe-S-cluster containining protein